MPHPVVMRRASALLALVALALAQGCVLEWVDYFSKLTQLGTGTGEHRVLDLRVLAIEAAPAELRYPLAFLDESADGSSGTLALRVEPFVYEPRGGDVDIAWSVCARQSSSLYGAPPLDSLGDASCLDADEAARFTGDVATSLAPLTTVVKASDEPGGRLPGLERTLYVDGPALRALLAIAEADLSEEARTSMQRHLELLVVLRVSRVWLGTPEDEWAVLAVPVAPDLANAEPARLEAFLDEHDAELCEPDTTRDCTDPAQVFEPPEDFELPPDATMECGNGVLEWFEQCDPPLAGSCTEACMLDNICERTCILTLPANQVPLVYGVDRPDGIAYAQPPRATTVDDAALHDGDTVTLHPGEQVFFEAVVDERVFAEDFALVGHGQSFATETPQLRWYTFGDGNLAAPVDFDGSYAGQGYNGGVLYASSADLHQPGEREPFVLVVADGRGGMRVVTLELAFE